VPFREWRGADEVIEWGSFFAAVHMSLIGTNLPIRNVRFHGESWRVSGRATEIVKTTFMTPESTLMALAER
jgi:hypothetical protein